MPDRQYHRGHLERDDIAADPFTQFGRWYAEAHEAGLLEPNAMTLATASREGRPSGRTVLLKGYDEHGFVFYTNLTSRKGRDLLENPHAALVFYWRELERQVLIAGPATQVPPEESDCYFASRPRESRLGAWASDQGAVLEGREALERRLREAERRFAGGEVPRPEHWGGVCVDPESVEFWQGRPSRLHDRFRYLRAAPDGWRIERLSP